MTTDEVGAQGVMDIGASARREIGTKINCVHDWCIGAVGFGMGRCGLLALEAIKPDDYVEESNKILKFMQRVLWGKRQDGYILNSQDRYRCQIHEQDFLDELLGADRGLRARRARSTTPSRSSTPPPSCCAFLDHYDCRLGLGDTGPYPLPDGRAPDRARPLRQRGGVPLERRLRRREAAALLHARRRDRPGDDGPRRDPGQRHLHHLHAAEELRRRPSPAARSSSARSGTPRWARSYPVKLDDLGTDLEKLQHATLKLYKKTARMSGAT